MGVGVGEGEGEGEGGAALVQETCVGWLAVRKVKVKV